VVGRLQFDGHLPPQFQNHLKRRFGLERGRLVELG
jgi:hypothetical protein